MLVPCASKTPAQKVPSFDIDSKLAICTPVAEHARQVGMHVREVKCCEEVSRAARARSSPSADFCLRLLSYAVALLAPMRSAAAHATEGGFVLLLNTRLFLIGGTLAVAVSFVILALLPRTALGPASQAHLPIGRFPLRQPIWPSVPVFLLLIGLVAAGYRGSPNPLDNPLPLVVWSAWWVGVTFLHVMFGNLWAWFNPWIAPYRLLKLLVGRQSHKPPLAYPTWLGYWPGVVLFLAFVWFELIYPAPQDPKTLADAVVLYCLVTLMAMLLFGERAWLQYGEAFAVFFRVLSWLAPFEIRSSRGQERRSISLVFPASALLRIEPLPVSGIAFVLLILTAISFDGLARTFWWLELVNVNPLEFPGRSAVVYTNSLGLLGMYGALVTGYVLAACLGGAIVGSKRNIGRRVGRFVPSIVPIAFGYHFAHYLPTFLIDIQRTVRALSDPLNVGWNLIGTRDLPIIESYLTDFRSVEIIFELQVGTIVVAHAVAVTIAHLLALSDEESVRNPVLGELPLAALMVLYTLFGLWLLTTPAAA
jgi:hypothetical protein